MVALDAGPKTGFLSGLEMIDGKNCAINETTRKGAVLKDGVAGEVLCSVRRNDILVSVDGKPVTEYKGDWNRLSLGGYWNTPNDRVLFVGAQDAAYRISRMELTARPEAEIAAERKKRKEAEQKAEQEWREALAGAFSAKTTGRVNRVFYGEDGKTFTSVGKGGVSVWSLTERKLLRTITDMDVCDGTCFAISSDGKRSVITGRDKTITWDLDQGKVIRTSSKVSPHGAGIFSPDGRFLALYTEKFNLSLVDLEADKILREIPKPKLDDWAPQFTPDGKRLVLYGGDYDPEWLKTRTGPARPGKGEIKEIDIESGKETRSYVGQEGPINRMAYSQDGTLMASVGWTTVRIWDTKTGKQLHSFNRIGPSTLRSTGCSFSPDNKFLGCAEGNLLVVWNTATGQKVFETDKGGDFAFSHDGRIAWSHDGLHVRDIASGKDVLNVKSAISFWNLGFSPNGKMVALGTEAGLVIVPIPSVALETLPTLALGKDMRITASEPGGKVAANKVELPKDARELTSRVHTVGEDTTTLKNGAAFNKFVQSLKVYATKKEIIVVCDIDTKNWVDVGVCFPLLIRVFDKDGKYVTHIITEERFTGSKAVYDNFTTMMGRIKDMPEEQRRKLGYFPPMLLEPTGNMLTYPVGERHLEAAVMVEVGFRRPR
jgi:WD40 repeat protein